MPITLLQARTDTRRFLKDDTENVWSNNDINSFINESIRIIKAKLPEYFTNLITVVNDTDTIQLESPYEFLLGMFASSRCFAQDEQFYRETKLMNEFESRLEETINKIYESDAYTTKLETDGVTSVDYVVDIYSNTTTSEVT